MGDGSRELPSVTNCTQEKNYILCHVRRVAGKKEDDDSPEPLSGLTETIKPVKKESEKKVDTPKSLMNSKISGLKMSEIRVEEPPAMHEDQIDVKAIEEQVARIKDVKRLGRLKAFKTMSVEQIKKLKLTFDGKPLSNYMINKYIKP